MVSGSALGGRHSSIALGNNWLSFDYPPSVTTKEWTNKNIHSLYLPACIVFASSWFLDQHWGRGREGAFFHCLEEQLALFWLPSLDKQWRNGQTKMYTPCICQLALCPRVVCVSSWFLNQRWGRGGAFFHGLVEQVALFWLTSLNKQSRNGEREREREREREKERERMCLIIHVYVHVMYVYTYVYMQPKLETWKTGISRWLWLQQKVDEE